MIFLSIPIAAENLCIAAEDGAAATVLLRLSALMGLGETLTSAPDSRPRVWLLDSQTKRDSLQYLRTEEFGVSVWWSEESGAVLRIEDGTAVDSPYFVGCCGKLLLSMAFALSPGDCLPLHGALLCRGGGGVALIGESGIGKSTTFRRHCRNGGDGSADDWLVVSFRERAVCAQALPTWSRVVRKGGLACRFPVVPLVSLEKICILGRAAEGEPPLLAAGDASLWFAGMLNACEMTMGWALEHLPPAVSQISRRNTMRQLGRLAERFSPLFYRASLTDVPAAVLF